jgi:hypothetical protein
MAHAVLICQQRYTSFLQNVTNLKACLNTNSAQKTIAI